MKEKKFYKSFDGMCWPNPCSDKLSDLIWRLRYKPDDITRNDKLMIASVMTSYKTLIADKTQKTRNSICVILNETPPEEV